MGITFYYIKLYTTKKNTCKAAATLAFATLQVGGGGPKAFDAALATNLAEGTSWVDLFAPGGAK